ncbi:MAG: signal peptidase II [Spirochaetes bacterium]|nr:MAG: signal peptidase II [Spirochaetota bacterium]
MAPATPSILKARLIWLFATIGFIVGLDQLTKELIQRRIPYNTVGARLWNDFLWIVHTKNLGIAFSIGDGLPQAARVLLFIGLPLVFLIFTVLYCLRAETLTRFQRASIYLIISGGLGNLIDRTFRPDGVVDFISLAFYGLFGLERFPTFNVADSSISVGAVLLILSGFLWSKEPGDVKGS